MVPNLDARDLRRVVIAAAVGNIIEWYDFYIFGALANSILAAKFFEPTNPVAGRLATVGLFTIGFFIRPPTRSLCPLWRSCFRCCGCRKRGA